MRLKSTINESTLSTADAVPLPQWGRLRYEDTAFLDTTPFPKGVGQEEAASPPKKEANPSSLRSAAPSTGRGSRGYSLLPLEGGTPKRRRLDGESGMKKSEGDHLKYAVNESTLSTATRSPFPNGEGCETRMPLFSHCQNKYTHMWKKNNDGQSLPRVGKAIKLSGRTFLAPHRGSCPKG